MSFALAVVLRDKIKKKLLVKFGECCIGLSD